MKLPTSLGAQNVQIVDHFALDKFIETHLGRAWSLQQNGFHAQEELVYFEVFPDPEATAVVEEWLASPPVECPGRVDQPGFAESVHIGTNQILNELCNRGLLPEGDLTVRVWW